MQCWLSRACAVIQQIALQVFQHGFPFCGEKRKVFDSLNEQKSHALGGTTQAMDSLIKGEAKLSSICGRNLL